MKVETAKTGTAAGVAPPAGLVRSGSASIPRAENRMKPRWAVSDGLIRLSIAMVWLYQGLWCKVLGGAPRHEAVIASAPFIGPEAARAAMVAIGLVECGLAVWVLLGWRRRWAAAAQTALLIGMNTAGLIWARNLLADPAGMILQNFAFVVLIWVAAENHHQIRREEVSHAGRD
jgi:uncharacterized membrane protein YphA (DoxX/SURF4 family)